MRKLVAATAAAGLALAGFAAPAAMANHKPQHEQGPPHSLLAKKVKVGELREHQQVFQNIADDNGGNRAAGTSGYAASAEYVQNQLERAGYDPELQHFTFHYYAMQSPTVFEQVAPNDVTYEPQQDFITYQYSGSGDVTAATEPVDTGSGDSGCQAADFDGFPEGEIALIKRGACSFEQKAQNAVDAGAPAVVIYNDGAGEDRMGPVNGTLGRAFEIPVVGPGYELGTQLVDASEEGLRLHLETDTVNEQRETSNVIAETERGNPDNVVVVGAHLDGVPEGAGINDNASGSATILEIAKQIRRGPPVNNKVRFTFWGAEEFGLLGSAHYVEQLSDSQLDNIALYLNYDMLGSPNFVRFIYDGDNSSGTGFEGPPGSGAIEQVYQDYFEGRDLQTAPTPFNGRSDYGPFVNVGIPSGGLFSGAEGIKSEQEAQVYGGTAGKQYDPCYHQACDDLDNVSVTGLDHLADGAAFAAERFAHSTEPVTGQGGGQVSTLSTPDRPAPERRGDHWVR